MDCKTIKIKKCPGVEIRVDAGWIIIGALLTWSLAQCIFPFYYRHLDRYTYWAAAACGTLLFMLFVVLHEISRALASRLTLSPIRSITLYVFGGVAGKDEEIRSATGELFVTFAGLLTNFLLYSGFYFLKAVAIKKHISIEYVGIIEFSMIANLIICLFNILPAYPLDGGRIIRVILWKIRKDIFLATKFSSGMGVVVGLMMILTGMFFLYRGTFISGILFLTYGIFLQNASRLSFQKYSINKAFEGESVANFMSGDPVTVLPSVSVESFIKNYLFRYHYKLFPIVENDKKLLGAINSQKAMSIPKDQWEIKKLSEIIIPCSSENTVHKNTDALKIMEMMIRTEQSKMMVIDSENRCVGMVALKDLLKLLSYKLDIQNV